MMWLNTKLDLNGSWISSCKSGKPCALGKIHLPPSICSATHYGCISLANCLKEIKLKNSVISKSVCCHHKNDVIEIQNLKFKWVCLFTCKLGIVSRLLGINGQDPSVSKSTGYMLTSLGFSFNKFKVYFLDSFRLVDNFPEVINFNR